MSPQEKPTILQKIVVSGTTSSLHEQLAIAISREQPCSHADAIIGVDIITKYLHTDKRSADLKLQFWFQSAQERFKSIPKSYYRGAVKLAIVCWDGTAEDQNEAEVLANIAKSSSVRIAP